MKPTKVFFENLKAYRDGFRIIVNKGSSRSGKTRGIIQAADFITSNSAKHRKLSIVSQSFPHLRDGAIYEYKKHIADENLGGYRLHNQGNHEFAVGKSIINYFSLGDVGGAQKAVGPGRDILFLNEPNKGISHENYVQLKQRTSECVWMDYNPSGQFWLHTEGIINDPRTIVIHSTWLDNLENLSKAQIQDFVDAKKKAKTSDYWAYWWKCYGEGQDAVLLEERIMPLLRRVKEVPKDAIEIPSALDFGWNPDPLFFGRLFVRKGKDGLKDDLFIKQVVYSTNLSINSKAPETKNLVELLEEAGIPKGHRIIAESARPDDISEMRMAGFSIEAVRKTSVETSIRTFHDYNIYIVDGSEDVFNEMDNYKYKRDKQTNLILAVPDNGQMDHSIDGVRYVLLSRNKRWSV